MTSIKSSTLNKTSRPPAASNQKAQPPKHQSTEPGQLQASLAHPGMTGAAGMLQLQRMAGNRAVQRLTRSTQPPAQQPIGPEGGQASGEVQTAIEQAQGGGQALDKTAGMQMGGALGADFSGVRVHTDARANAINRSLGAQAATVGGDIFFSEGAYNPGTQSGQQLLAHELTHVVQQGGTKPNKIQTKLMVGAADDAYERQAHEASANLSNPTGAKPKALSSNGQPVIQRLMKHQKVKKEVNKIYESWIKDEFSAKAGKSTYKDIQQHRKDLDKHEKSKKKRWEKSQKHGTKFEQIHAPHSDLSYSHYLKEINARRKFDDEIDKSYQEYEKEPKNLGKMSRIYDAIAYWQTVNYRELSSPKGDQVRPTLNLLLSLNSLYENVQGEIKNEVQSKTQRMGGNEMKFGEMSSDHPGALVDTPMPVAFTDVGIAPGYYGEHLKGKQSSKLLQDLYTHLHQGEMLQASKLMSSPVLTSLPGWSLIRSLFLSHFSNQASLSKLVGVAQKSGKLTQEEADAITAYIGTSDPANNALRAVDLSDGKMKEADKYATLVAAISKLQPFKGIAYRGINPYAGMDAVWQPGGVVSDLAFTSAAASMSGVEFYLKNAAVKNAQGSQNYYCIIHTKTAVHISDRAREMREAEVLFRPGTRFRIKAIWKHNAGNEKVPPNAPVEAQMIMHRVGKYKTEKGKQREEWDKYRKDEEAYGRADPGAFEQQQRHQLKVFELVEM